MLFHSRPFLISTLNIDHSICLCAPGEERICSYQFLSPFCVVDKVWYPSIGRKMRVAFSCRLLGASSLVIWWCFWLRMDSSTMNYWGRGNNCMALLDYRTTNLLWRMMIWIHEASELSNISSSYHIGSINAMIMIPADSKIHAWWWNHKGSWEGETFRKYGHPSYGCVLKKPAAVLKQQKGREPTLTGVTRHSNQVAQNQSFRVFVWSFGSNFTRSGPRLADKVISGGSIHHGLSSGVGLAAVWVVVIWSILIGRGEVWNDEWWERSTSHMTIHQVSDHIMAHNRHHTFRDIILNFRDSEQSCPLPTISTVTCVSTIRDCGASFGNIS